ncbi:hypothetical protein NMY22_g10088 [Coprinellus aureogranulatus]|nr:hypothetical protein NMY22_g10088 [Coprinellus aureogranulatus]
MRFTTLSSTTAVVVYLMSVTGSVSAAPIADALASRDVLDADFDLEARIDDLDARDFDVLEDVDAREFDDFGDFNLREFNVDVDDLEARGGRQFANGKWTQPAFVPNVPKKQTPAKQNKPTVNRPNKQSPAKANRPNKQSAAKAQQDELPSQ